MNRVLTILLILGVAILVATFAAYIYIFRYNGRVDFDIPVVNAEVLGVGTSRNESNFELPEDVTYIQDDLFNKDIQKRITDSENPGGSYVIKIPKHNIENTVEHSNDLDVLKNNAWLMLPWTYIDQSTGWWPWSSSGTISEPIITCYRRYFGASNSKSCWNLNKLKNGDEIIFNDVLYKVQSVVVRPRNQKTVFEPDLDGEYIKIISTSGPNGDTSATSHYIVVVAKKVEVVESE